MSNNPFFKIALTRASRLLGKNGRLILLLAQLTRKLQGVSLKDVSTNDFKEKFFVLGRLLRAYAKGQYREIPWKTLLLITAAVVYFITPIDLIPDLVPVLGFTDDLGIMMSVYAAVALEIERFLQWEKSQPIEIS